MTITITAVNPFLYQIQYPFFDKETEIRVFRWLISNLPASSSLLGILTRPFATPTHYPNSTEEDGRISTDSFPVLFTNAISLINPEVQDDSHQIEALLHSYGTSLRVFVSSESVLALEKYEIDSEGRIVFEREDMQALYEKSICVLTSILDNCIDFQQTVHLSSLNRIWSGCFTSRGKLGYRIPAIKLTLASTDLSLEGESTLEKMNFHLPRIGEELIDDSLSEIDLDYILENNKIKYPRTYIDDCIKVSHCLRSKHDGSLVSWGVTHGDMAVGCLHTLGQYRKRSLGRKVLYELALKHLEYHRNYLPYKEGEIVYIHADTEIWNETTVQVMHKCGYKSLLQNEWFSIVLGDMDTIL
ncbi:hypothetical protein K7432_009541 [Basidiobolus ranarum]|uniref:N-acetyltransferase domain-containing protein n=1 Tax=Basidiobolus ranarum TaxID=34480 RepID=A0ABR2WQ18_9FUNG